MKLSANSSSATATLKLSMDQLFGSDERLYDLTLSAPTAKSGTTSLDNTSDGLAGGISAQLTRTKYFLLPPGDKPTYFGIVGAGGKIGHQTHTYVDVSDLSKTHDVTKTPSSYLAYAGVAPVSMKWLVLAKFEYQDAFKDSKTSETKCPAQATGPVTCQSGPIGAPTKNNGQVWSLEARKAWESVAVGASLARNTGTKVTTFDLPLYLVSGNDGKGGTALTGGLDFAWDTQRHAVFGLFIGSAFSVLDY